MKVPFALPECGQEEINEVIGVIKSGWLTTASRCQQFEKDFAKFIGVTHARAVDSRNNQSRYISQLIVVGLRYPLSLFSENLNLL